MRCLSSRRLTGPNLLWNRYGAVIDVEFGDVDPDTGIRTWESYVQRMLEAVGWGDQQTCTRALSGGASLAISAPLDALYSATAVSDWAWQAACDKLLKQVEPLDMEADAQALRDRITSESNPAMLSLVRAAQQNGCTALVDPDVFSIGMGANCQQWALDALPQSQGVDWSLYQDIPVALITGTNGKTTSARLTSAIVKAFGLRPGMSSTDGVMVDGTLVEKGDYSGPGGARAVLRHPDTEFAVLETARGGLLRRGLGVTRADAALITNIASDHIGQFGVNDLEELADVKWIVSRALAQDGTLILNADDPLLVERGLKSDLTIIWFSPDADNEVFKQHLALGGTVCTVVDKHIAVMSGAAAPRQLIPVANIPITHNGKASYNVANVLGVVGLTRSMGISDAAIVAGLGEFDEASNPGRTNFLQVNGATVLVDFAHNTHGLNALLSFAAELESNRRLLLIGHAGDRTDQDIRDLARCADMMSFDRIIIKTLDRLRRGREPGVIEALLRDQFLTQGVAEETLGASEDEMSGIKAAVDWAQPGDLLVLLTHDNKQEVLDYLTTLDK